MNSGITAGADEHNKEIACKEENGARCAAKRKVDVSTELAYNIVKHMKRDHSSGYTDATFEEAEYYFENGLRKVYPYYFTYSTFCKGRWVGKTLIDVYSKEFRAFTSEHYMQSILAGDVLVNNKKVSPEYALKDNDCITNKVHRHEVAVVASPIKIIHLSDDLVVVDKPPSIPVHPCGRYRHNSLLFILAKEHNLKDLHTIHRLDRLTSGVMILTRTLRKSQELDEQVRSRQITKEYLCRVEGLFPDGIIICNEPIEVLSPKIGVCIVSPSGKECFTEFQKISYNGKSSVVRCMPKTGRMHQIRVHLQYLGYPIMNDPIYDHKDAFGPMKGKGGETGKSKEKLLNDLLEIHNLENWLQLDETAEEPPKTLTSSDNTLFKILNQRLNMDDYEKLENKYKKDPAKFNIDRTCHFCQKRYKDPEPKDLILFLHAFRYKGSEWEFQTELPAWAKDDWTDM